MHSFKEMRTGDRFVLKNNYITSTESIPEGIICTVIVADTNVILRYGYNSETDEPKIFSMSSLGIEMWLKEATRADLKDIPLHNQLSKPYRPESKFKVSVAGVSNFKVDEILTVDRVTLSFNEQHDLFIFKDDRSVTRAKLDYFFNVYDEEIESKFGQEITIDRKTAERNYFIEGAKALYGTKVVAIVSVGELNCEIDEFDVKYGTETQLVEKAKLIPIQDYQSLLNSPKNEVAYDLNGKRFVVNTSNKPHIFRAEFSVGDVIEVEDIDQISANIYEDIYIVKKIIDEDHYTSHYLNLRSLKEYFTEVTEETPVKQTEVITQEYIDQAFEPPQKDEVVIHSLSINGTKFNLDTNKIYFETNSISKNDIDSFIESLNKLKQYI